MPGQLATLIRNKYPGQYDDMDDATLESSILAKYPDYADLVEETPTPVPAPVGAPAPVVAPARPDPNKFVNTQMASAEDYEPTLSSSLQKGQLGSFLATQAGRFWKGINEPFDFAKPIIESATKFGPDPKTSMGQIYKESIGSAFSPLGIGSELLGAVGLLGKYGRGGRLPQIADEVVSGAVSPKTKELDLSIVGEFDPEYTKNVLNEAGVGKPGLSETVRPGGFFSEEAETWGSRSITYRDPQGNPIATAKIMQTPDGQWLVDEFAADKTKGLLYGRAVKSVGEKLMELGATKPASVVTPSSFNIMKRAGLIDEAIDIAPIKAAPEIPVTPELPSVAPTTIGPELPIGPVTSQLPIKPEIPEPIAKLLGALEESKPLTKEQAKIYSTERGQRVAKAEAIETKGLAGHYEKLGQLAGEHTKVSMEPLKLEQPDIDALADIIENTKTLQFYERRKATDGLVKILAGRVPQDNEIRLLGEVFGPDVINNIRAKLPKIDTKRTLLSEAANFPRAIQSSWDISFPFRQGLPLIHTKAWWTSWDDMLKSFGSEKAYRGVMDSILDHPNFQGGMSPTGKNLPSFAEESGLKLSDLTDLSKREEAIMSTWAEKIPGVRRSNRAYTAFANKLRADNFNSMITDAERLYESTKALAKNPAELAQAEKLNPRTNLALSKEIAGYINNASGRGDLGKLERHAQLLNSTLFSPRLIASRVQMMNPLNYISKSPQVRQAYLKSLLATAGAWMTVAGLGKAAGGDVSLSPMSSDFGKVRIGNARLDPAGGFQQYLVLLSRLASGQTTSSTTGVTSELGGSFAAPTRKDIMERFGKGKLVPPLTFAYDMLNASKYRPFNAADRTAQLFIPMIAQDAIEIAKEDPSLLPFLLPLTAIGMGTQVYGERPEALLFEQ